MAQPTASNRQIDKKRDLPTGLEQPAYKFSSRPVSQAKKKFLEMHQILENVYNKDGSWCKGYSDWDPPNDKKRKDLTHPLVRFSGRIVQAYLIANAIEPNQLYSKRAREGLEWLLKEQEPNGAFRWYYSKRGTVNRHSLYDTGIAARALAEGYLVFKDRRYLIASQKAADWEASMPVDSNANYNMFAVSHLVIHFRLTKEKKYLDAALKKALVSLRGQTKNGNWSDHHNQQIVYHCIIAEGLVDLLTSLPEHHPQKKIVQQGLERAANHIISQQLKDGSLRRHPKGGLWTGYGPGAMSALPVFDTGSSHLGWKTQSLIAGFIRSPMGPEPHRPHIDPKKKETWNTLLDDAVRFYAIAWRWTSRQSR